MNIIDAIEQCDLSASNAGFREETCSTIIRGLKEIRGEYHLCESVKRAFRTIYLAEQRHEELSWWCDAFVTYKDLWCAIESKEAEKTLSDADRSPNLRLLEALLFSAKITILAITTETECDDCCTESLRQLVHMVQFVRLNMNSGEPTAENS